MFLTKVKLIYLFSHFKQYVGRRQPKKNDGTRDEESIDLMQGTPIEASNKVQRTKLCLIKRKTFLLRKAW